MVYSDVAAAWDSGLGLFLYSLQQHITALGMGNLDIRTEHIQSGTIFRGHPNFRGRGQWNDWAIIDWGTGRYGGQFPAEIWCFVDLSDSPAGFRTNFAQCSLERGVYAVVESSTDCPNVLVERDCGVRPKNESKLFKPIIKEVDSISADGSVQRKFYLANVEAIVGPVCVVPDIGNANKARYFQLLPKSEWADRFKRWVRAPHSSENVEMADTEDEMADTDDDDKE